MSQKRPPPSLNLSEAIASVVADAPWLSTVTVYWPATVAGDRHRLVR